MTSQPQPTPGPGRSAGQYLSQVRDLAAYTLVGATAVFLFVALIDLIPGNPGGFGEGTNASFGRLINLVTVAFPIGAVLLALLVRPAHPKARLIVVAALVEYAVMAVFGLLFGVLFGLINLAADHGARAAFEGLLVRVAWLAVFAVAAYAVYLIWRNLFYVPKPKPQPGVYGQPQPQYGAPGNYPGHPSQPAPPAPSGPGYPPASYAPGVYGQPTPGWNPTPPPAPGGIAETQQVPPGMTYPLGPDPTQVVPTSGAGPAPSYGPAATQIVPQSGPPTIDRTEKISDDRPGFGPADDGRPRW